MKTRLNPLSGERSVGGIAGMISCEWMGVLLRSPIVLASLTLFSKPNLQKHIEYFSQAISYGVGAIILPSIHPLRANENIGSPHTRTVPITSGIGKDANYMGFAILGTTDNIVSMEYGLTLAKNAVKLNVPIFGSIANIGTKKEYLHALQQLLAIDGLSGVELNFSCPNVLNGIYQSIELLQEIREMCKIPISIKLAPDDDYTELINHKYLFDSITCSNAYTGLVPPEIDLERMSPFSGVDEWRPSGIYGPLEKVFTFRDIWKFKMHEASKKIALSSVGGFVSPEDVVQAIMLGANTVQLSSAVFWKGLRIINECNTYLESVLTENRQSLASFTGIARKDIKTSETGSLGKRRVRTMFVDNDKCLRCPQCACIERGCYAISKVETFCAQIDNNLCSGCGWCQNFCVAGAIAEKI